LKKAMKNLLIRTLAVILGAGAVEIVRAQEVLVPLDQEGRLETIERKLERELRLFPDHPGFREARLFQLSDTTFALEIFYRQEEELFKDRRLLAAEQVAELRRKIAAQIQLLRPRSLQDRKGRTRFLVRTFILSYGFYSWAIPVSLDLDGRSMQITALLTGSAGFVVPFSITNKIPVSQTSAVLSAHGGTTGIAHGVLLSFLLFGEEDSPRKALGLGTVGSLSGLAGGFALASKMDMSAGTAEVVGLGGNYGLALGLGAVHLADLFDEDHARLIGAAGLVGSGLGYWGGRALAGGHPYTRGDAEALGTTTVLGAYLAIALMNLTDTENPRAYTAAAMAGSGVGLGLGHGALKDKNFTTGESRMMILGALGGYLLGGATNHILGANSEQAWLSLTSLGALGGFWFTYRSFAGEAQVADREVAWTVRLVPQSLVARGLAKRRGRSGRFSPLSLPLLTYECSFY